MWEYTDKVKEAFLRPRNVGEIANADAIGEVGSIVCGDALKLYLRIDRETDRILDARFQTFGCASAIASSSALTELIRGKTLDQALAITNQDIADYLGGLPAQKMHCSVMGQEALEAAIANYRGAPVINKDAERVVCKCFDVTEQKIRRVALDNHLTTIDEITNFTKAGGGCGECKPEIEKLLLTLWPAEKPIKPLKPDKLTNLQKIALIQEVVENDIRPLLQADSGDVEIIDIIGNEVIVALRGICSGCSMSEVTLKKIQKKLQELVSQDIVVQESR